jgi:hypothetical protein
VLSKPEITREYLRKLRELAKQAVGTNDSELALDIVKAIRANDLLIAAPPPPVNYVKYITLKHPGMCQSCGLAMQQGEQAAWKESSGVWHTECYVAKT